MRAIVRDTSRAKGLLPSSVQFVEANILKSLNHTDFLKCYTDFLK